LIKARTVKIDVEYKSKYGHDKFHECVTKTPTTDITAESASLADQFFLSADHASS
jgi:hypothetical protein